MTVLYEDDFNRTVSGGIGRPSDYDNSFGQASSSVNGSEALVNANSSSWWEWIGSPRGNSWHLYYDFWVPANVADTSCYYEVDPWPPASGGTHGSWVWATAAAAGQWEVGMFTPGTDLILLFTPTASTWYTLHAELDAANNMARASVWERGQSEPSSWMGEQAHTGNSVGTWNPWLGIDAAVAEAAKFDNLILADAPIPTGPQFNLDAWIYGVTVDGTFTVDAVLKTTTTVSRSFSAVLQPGAQFTLGAEMRAAEQVTTHARSGPHFGETPDTAIVLSAPLGTLSSGDTLQQALRELDDLIRQRERGE